MAGKLSFKRGVKPNRGSAYAHTHTCTLTRFGRKHAESKDEEAKGAAARRVSQQKAEISVRAHSIDQHAQSEKAYPADEHSGRWPEHFERNGFHYVRGSLIT